MRRFLYLNQNLAEAIIIPLTVLSIFGLVTGDIRLSSYFLALFIGLIFAGAAYIVTSNIGFVWGVGFEPTNRSVIERVFELAKPQPGMVVFDLGSGLGRVVIQLAERHNLHSIGVEVDPLKVWWTRLIVRRKGLQNKIKIVKSNLLDVDLSNADLVYVFLWPTLMLKVKRKVMAEMKPGSRIISHFHLIPGWAPVIHDKEFGIAVYEIGKTV